MAFVAGQNLEQLVQRARKRRIDLPLEFSCRLATDVLLALHYAHGFVEPATGNHRHGGAVPGQGAGARAGADQAAAPPALSQELRRPTTSSAMTREMGCPSFHSTSR